MRRLVLAAALICVVTSTGIAANGLPAHQILRDGGSGFARTVDVAVEGPVDDGQISALVRALAATTSAGRQTLVNVYLPGMKAGEAPFASGTHAGGVAVTLRTTEASATETAGTGDDAGWRLRQWDMTWPEPGGQVRISRQGQRVRLTLAGANGEPEAYELAAAPSLRGMRFDVLAASRFSHFIVRPDGGLEAHGRSGLIGKGVPTAGAEAGARATAGGGVAPPPPRRPVDDVVTASSIIVVQPWPLTGDRRLAVARSVLMDKPAPAVVAKAAQPEVTPAAAAQAASVRRQAAAQPRQSTESEQARIWKSLARFLQPQD